MTGPKTGLCGCTLCATFLHAPRSDRLELAENALIRIDATGVIRQVLTQDDPDHAACLAQAKASGTLTELARGTVLLPGFVDLHVHAPQYPQLGRALDLPLEDWLQDYTFPLEARYADPAFAARVYEALVADLLAQGSTTAVYFATAHLPATKLLADLCIARGQRALVGKVVMDHPDTCPDFYRDASTDAAIAETRALIDHVRGHPDNARARVRPVITPRFIPSCTTEALERLGRLATETGCHIQTHCSESDWEHGHVIERFGQTDTASLADFGLLTRHTVLAHSNFLSPDDRQAIVRAGAGVAHCAHSNAYFAGAAFPLRRALSEGLHVGLGTDISGGPASSVFDAARMTIAASRMLDTGVDPELPADRRGVPGSRIDATTAFHLATAGGAEVLDLPVGSFEAGRHFDAMAVDTTAAEGTIRLFEPPESPQDLLQTLLYNTSRGNIARVWVDGRAVA